VNDHIPVADAADVIVKVGQQARLDATGSQDPDGDFITGFHWAMLSAPAGSQSVLDSSDQAIAFLTPDMEGIYYVGLAVQSKGAWSAVKVVRVFAVIKTAAWLDGLSTTRSVPEMILAGGLNLCVLFNQNIDDQNLVFTAVSDNPKVDFKNVGGSGAGTSICGRFRPSKGRFADLSVGDHILALGTAKGLVSGDVLSFAVEMTVVEPPPPAENGPVIAEVKTDPLYYPNLAAKFIVRVLDPDGDLSASSPQTEMAFLPVEDGCQNLLAIGASNTIPGFDDGTHGDEKAGDGQYTFPFTPNGALAGGAAPQCTFESALRFFDGAQNRSNAVMFTIVVTTK